MALDLTKIKFDEHGLVPAVVQDVKTKAVVMLAYMNQESLLLTIKTGYTWFWSRSRQELWNKGATSGNLQKVVEMCYDCDGDAILIKAKLSGPACHTGQYSCFHNII
ncbi:MAG: phosphoribosyl-AMP cyclohydrolase [Phascolarctobacterium sp.]|nr:phosphoribosyl-AMP cyclohydrolase [Phascolarctobacterium sp.]